MTNAIYSMHYLYHLLFYFSQTILVLFLSLHFQEVKMRLGDQHNPLKLMNENSKRPLLEKYAQHTTDEGFDHNQIKSYGTENYIYNLIFNQHLTLAEVKLGLLLHEQLKSKVHGDVYDTSADLDFIPAYVYGCYIEDKKGIKHHTILAGRKNSKQGFLDFRSDKEGSYNGLYWSAKALGLNLTPQRFVSVLKRLHDFGYITITDISPDNCYESKKAKNGSNPLERRVRLRHIRLHKGAMKKIVFSRFIDKPRKSKTKSQA